MSTSRLKVSMVGATLIASLLMAACSADPVSPTTSTAPPTAAEIELVKHENLWIQRAPERYTLTIFNQSENPQDENDISLNPECGEQSLTKSIVELGEITLAADVYQGCLVDVSSSSRPLSVEQLFAEAAGHPDADTVEVKYDKEFGYPRSIHIWYPDQFIAISVQKFDPDTVISRAAEKRLIEVDAARITWEKAGIASYTATVEVICFCGIDGPIQVAVTDGILTSRLSQGTMENWVDESYLTVDGIFRRISGAVFADKLSVIYDNNGIPSTTIIDPGGDTVDDELTIQITNFQPTP